MDAEELLHITASIVLVSVAFSIFPMTSDVFKSFYQALFTVGIAFAAHELGHKFVAKRFGRHAVFRIWTPGLVLAIVLAVFTQGQLVFAAPGAVEIHGGPLSKRESALVALAGPGVNLLLGVLSLFAIASFGSSELLRQVASVNAFLAVFNLIPFYPLDGEKVNSWNPLLWASSFGVSAALLLA